MKIDDVDVTEPRCPMSFATPERLKEHVDKHVFGLWQEERWRNVLNVSSEDMATAREDWWDDNWSEQIRAIAAEYERWLAEFMEGLCSAGHNHIHVVSFTLPADIIDLQRDGEESLKARMQFVLGWDHTLKTICIAAQPVRKVSQRPYHLKTGYRLNAKWNVDRVRAKIKGMKAKMLDYKQCQLLADHEKHHG